jgi:hypothetical protein
MASLFSSSVFWTAIGSIAAMVAAVAAITALVRHGRASDASQPDTPSSEVAVRQRVQAAEAATEFNYWMTNYNHPGNRSDAQELVAWVEIASGFKTVSSDYAVFRQTAELLAADGYSTLPAPTEVEFRMAVTAGERGEARMERMMERGRD